VSGRRKKRLMSDMNVVPYIDVMLVLLIIFMITAPLVTQGVKVDLPQTSSQPIESSEQEPLIVSVNAQGQVFVNFGGDEDEPLEPEGLLTRIAALLRTNPQIPVYMRGDRAVDYGRVVQVMAMLKEAGVANVGLVSEPPSD
jgi:biopolymer transport protein TolR